MKGRSAKSFRAFYGEDNKAAKLCKKPSPGDSSTPPIRNDSRRYRPEVRHQQITSWKHCSGRIMEGGGMICKDCHCAARSRRDVHHQSLRNRGSGSQLRHAAGDRACPARRRHCARPRTDEDTVERCARRNEVRNIYVECCIGSMIRHLDNVSDDRAARRKLSVPRCGSRGPIGRNQFEYDPAASRPLNRTGGSRRSRRCAVQVAPPVLDQPGVRRPSLRARKVMQYGLGAVRTQLEYGRAAVIGGAAGRAIEVAGGVHYQTSARTPSVPRGSTEAEQQRFRARGAQLVHGAAAISAPIERGAIEVARAVHDHTRDGTRSVVRGPGRRAAVVCGSGEAVKHGLCTVGA